MTFKRFLLLALFLLAVPTIVLGQPEASRSVGRSFLALLLTWSPIILFVGFFVWYLRKVGFGSIKAQRERQMRHMEIVENELRSIRELLQSRLTKD